ALWAESGGAWTQITGELARARSGSPMVFERARSWCFLFGGYGVVLSTYQYLGDTWAFDGNAWSSLPVIGPPARTGHAMVYDSGRDEVVLFGGDGTEPGYRADTWVWNGSSWADRQVTGPSARA